MTLQDEIRSKLNAGELSAALAMTKEAVRQAAAKPERRFLLFQLLSLAGDWESAAKQLAACKSLQTSESKLIPIMEGVLQAELVRERVFRAEDTPAVFGEPTEWMTLLAQAFATAAEGDLAAAEAQRAQALEAAPASGGVIDGEVFPWLVDADSRLGPVWELIMNGRYCWVSPAHLRTLEIHPPEQPRDLIWRPVRLTLDTGGVLSAFLPARYPGAAAWNDDALRMGRRMQWPEPGDGQAAGGRGQKLWLSENADYQVLGVRHVEFTRQRSAETTHPAPFEPLT